MQKNSTKIKIDVKLTLLLVLIVVLVLALYNNLNSYFLQKKEFEEVKINLQEIEDENKKIMKDLLMVDDPDYLEGLIRKKLGKQKEGENVYIIPIPSLTPTP